MGINNKLQIELHRQSKKVSFYISNYKCIFLGAPNAEKTRKA
jgi:hypothetical protein